MLFAYPEEEIFSVSTAYNDLQDDRTTNALLGITEDHYAQPEGHFGLSTIEELELAIQNCKQLILQTPTKTDRMKNLVGKLVQLRLKYAEAKEGPREEDPGVKMVVGHHFMRRESKSSKHYCEKCNNVIWGVLQYWYRCNACGFCCHEKCLNLITRTCGSLKVKENPSYIIAICPEKGLAAQNYRCHECRAQISYREILSQPRLCDYTGFYFCDLCHWNDTMVIPARVLHNWDFDPRKVSRSSKQFLKLMPLKAVLRIQDINPMLFSFVEELNEVKKLREELLIMKRYFLSCRDALESKLLLQLRERQHFVESSDMYSFQDLIDIHTDALLPILARIHSSFAQHIKTDCQVCQGKGFICELCDEDEVLFPFDSIAIVCSQCSTVLHRHCYMRRNQKCPKCIRMNLRTPEALNSPKRTEKEDVSR
ncbi:hypothetical protein CAPTEDRAFT_101688 [Capitella teleta]|uniref:Phorbol-ester/DAG-type domain-containing protein n=1 Tax=Capitella teleta TaxID=283909 RepID=R7TQ67_CAPTE|nr:hypothetical protein CAPTEDRAFT_101688 [Capitella teleta]|eukprot:ELT95789.1 hypothetical protein CAPTEDRAFT_101688 [Capitella teleta]